MDVFLFHEGERFYATSEFRIRIEYLCSGCRRIGRWGEARLNFNFGGRRTSTPNVFSNRMWCTTPLCPKWNFRILAIGYDAKRLFRAVTLILEVLTLITKIVAARAIAIVIYKPPGGHFETVDGIKVATARIGAYPQSSHLSETLIENSTMVNHALPEQKATMTLAKMQIVSRGGGAV